MVRGRRAVRRTAAVVVALVLAACSSSADTPTRAPASSAATPTRPAASLGDVSVAPGQQLPPPPEGGFGAPVTVVFDGAPPLRADVAHRPDQRRRGLMQRTELPDGTGMIFLFPQRQSGGFWMLGTLVPLSIAYVDGDTVVSTAEMVPCTTPRSECPSYPSSAPYTAAVEAPAGFFPQHGVKAGTKMRVDGATPAPI